MRADLDRRARVPARPRHRPRGSRAAAPARALAVALALAAATAACRRAAPPAPPTAEGLAAYVADLAARAAGDPAAAARELAGWPLDAALWQRTVVAPYRARFADVNPAPRLAALAAALAAAPAGPVTARRHYAGDAHLTPGQAWLRWALPPLYPSYVAELAGRPLDTVLLHDGARWRALVGADDLIDRAARALDPACAELLRGAAASPACAKVGWMIADAALGTDRERFARACRIAATLCGKGSS